MLKHTWLKGTSHLLLYCVCFRVGGVHFCVLMHIFLYMYVHFLYIYFFFSVCLYAVIACFAVVASKNTVTYPCHFHLFSKCC